MVELSYTFTSECWLWQAEKAAWHFISVPSEASQEIQFFSQGLQGGLYSKPRGWGAVKVLVSIGQTRWETSIFPDSKRGGYLLPIKQAVRKAEKIIAGQAVEVRLRINM